jgi:hypothetical protein
LDSINLESLGSWHGLAHSIAVIHSSLLLRYPQSEAARSLPLAMNLTNRTAWEGAAGLTLLATFAVGTIWYLRRKRPSAEEIERARRTMLAKQGRLVDGMLLDVREMEMEGGSRLTLLEYSYRSAGVDYECSQDITSLLHIVDPSRMRAGFPCSVRYQTGSPQNSIVLAEGWSGLRSSLPVFPIVGERQRDEDPNDLGHLRPGRG